MTSRKSDRLAAVVRVARPYDGRHVTGNVDDS
jgi:hypothetical protein